MEIWFLILCAIFIFAVFTFARKWHDYAVLFTFAIGFAVNANIYNGSTTPVFAGDFIFAIDSILYTGFMFAIIICAKEYGIKKAKILTYTSVAAILVSAVIELLANISAFGYSFEFMLSFLGYNYSIIGTLLGVWLMLFVYQKLEDKNVNIYLSFLICVLIASVINSTVYYGALVLTMGNIENLVAILIGSYLGKFFCIILGQIGFLVNSHWWIPVSLQEKYFCLNDANKTTKQNALKIQNEKNCEKIKHKNNDNKGQDDCLKESKQNNAENKT